MNLSSCKEICVDGKTVAVLSLNGKQVYTSSDVRLYLTCSKSYILAGETAVLTVYTNLPEDTEIELYYYGDSLTKTLLDTVETDENGVAEYTYTGTGAGELSLFAEYDEYTSNIVILDDYEPVATSVVLGGVSSSSVTVGTSVSLTGTVTDQHGVGISGLTVTFKHGSTTIGTATTDGSGVATKSWATDTVGSLSITAICSGVTSSAQTLNVVKHSSALSTSMSSTSAYVDGVVSLSGTLKIDDVGTSGLAVKIYKDSTLLDTVTTTSGGAFSKSTSFSSTGSHTLYAVYEGSSVNESATGSTYTITVSKVPTSLSINVPQLVYSDVFSITGVLKDTSNNAINNASVKLYMETGGATTLEATGTTNSSGEVTFNRQAPTSITNYKFWLVYEGTTKYSNVNSSEETRTVGKETSVLTITSPSNNASFIVGDSVTVSGTLLSNDGEAMTGKSVLVKESGTTLTTLTTDSNGAFTGSLSSLASGSHSLSIEFAGDTYYTSVTGSRTITLSSVTPSSVSLTSNKSVLSYADSDSATLTASVTGSDTNPYSGATVEIYSGSNKLGNATDNNDGTYSYTLASTGAGDLSLTAKVGSLVSESYSLEDCRKYISTSSTVTMNTKSRVNNVADFGVLNQDGLSFSCILQTTQIQSNVAGICVVNDVQTSDISPYPSGYIDYRLFSDMNNKGFGGGKQDGGDYGMDTTSGAISTNTDYLFEMKFQNSQLTGKITKVSDSSVVYNKTITPPMDYTNYHFALFIFRGSTATVSVTYHDVKIKPIFTLSSNKSVLSYADSDTCTLTATHPLGSGKTVNLYKSSDNSLIGAMTDNNDGTYSYTYTSTGAGDISMYASDGSLASETYSLEDCLGYAPTELYKTGSKVQYSLLNGFNFANTGDWEISCDLKTSKGYVVASPFSNGESMTWNDFYVYAGMGMNSAGAKLCALGYAPTVNDGTIWVTTGTYGSDYANIKFTKVGNKYTFYYNNSEVTNTTSLDFSALTPLYLYLRVENSGTAYIKNLKIKAL